jgi:hypothetical protein
MKRLHTAVLGAILEPVHLSSTLAKQASISVPEHQSSGYF